MLWTVAGETRVLIQTKQRGVLWFTAQPDKNIYKYSPK